MKPYLTIFVLFPLWLTAQFTDDFDDGDFTENPAWQGNTDRFIVNDADELQLLDENAGSANESYLSVAAATSNDAETTWEFFARLTFSPSTSNLARVYLSASNPDLTASQNGYFIQIGGISGSEDALELVRQDGNATSTLATATAGAVGSDPATARVRVVRNGAAWQLFADYTGGTNYALEATATDGTYASGNFIGVVAEYTSSRAENFFFDDFLVDPLFVDTESPLLLTAEATADDEVLLTFNEPLDPATAENPDNYALDNGITVADAQLVGTTQVRLLTGQTFTDETTYTVTANGVTDTNGNALTDQTATFTFVATGEAARFDVLINEIMADPSPPVELPEAEFVELFNRSEENFQLEGWTLRVGNNAVPLPDFVLRAGAYVTLTDAEFTDAFAIYGEVVGIPLPALTNSGTTLELRDDLGTVLHSVSYTNSWYRDATKDDGGYSLELINPLAVCAGSENWRASNGLLGGTPGRENSVFAPAPDAEAPRLQLVFPNGANELLLTFSEALDPLTAADGTNYAIDQNVEIEAAELIGLNQVRLTLATSLEPQTVYELNIRNQLTDCLGNPIGLDDRLRFGLPEPAAAGDVVLNEILFNAATGGDRYVELYNRSPRILNLADLNIAAVYGDSSIIEPVEVEFLFLPDEYVVLTEDRLDVLNRYAAPAPQNVVETPLPPINDREGNLTVFVEDANGNALILDAFDYSRDFLHPLLDDQNGVALERINSEVETQNPAHWHAAAETAGFGTPTAPNSQFFAPDAPESSDFFTLSNDRISPDGDGFEDFILIQYATDRPDWLATAVLFDAAGREVTTLFQSQLLANEGSFQFDGTLPDGSRARLGIYILWIEYFLPTGEVRSERETLTVVARL